jgi:methylated-DNA-[protein]-cysteine S-methyltransferase
MNTFKIIDSPIGGLVLVARGASLVGLYHEYHSPEPSPVLLGLPFVREPQTGPSKDAESPRMPTINEDTPSTVFQEVDDWLQGYFEGSATKPLPYELVTGTDFQRAVWNAVSAIPYGETRTYKNLADALGNGSMGRAVGAAVRANPLSILIPGHRVVGSGGAITGYAAGIPVKRALLELEAAVLGGAAA